MSNYEFYMSNAHKHVGGNIIQGDPLTYAPRVWGYMIDRFQPRSVLDVGSGMGHAARWFHMRGLASMAFDAAAWNVDHAIHPTIHHDLLCGSLKCPVDLVHCQEVAEHIPESHVDNFIRTLTNGPTVLMSHATPGQVGYHHVNLQEDNYWIEKMAAVGYILLDIDTERVRRYALKEGAEHLARSGLVFARSMG